MMSSNFEVTFRVKVSTKKGETVCVVGDCEQLGNWSPTRAPPLQLESHTNSTNDGEIWSRTVKLPGFCDYKYRYFVCSIRESDNEDSERNVIVTRWETNIRPRRFSPKACLNSEDCDTNTAEFGYYDGRASSSRGWLINQTEVQLRLYVQPINMWKARHKQQTYRVKCTPRDHRYRDFVDLDGEPEEESRDDLPCFYSTFMSVSVLNDTEFLPSDLHLHGNLVRDGEYMVFRAQTYEPEYLGFQLDFFVQHPSGSEEDIPKHVGYAYLLPYHMQDTLGKRTVHISGLKHRPIGQITVEHFIAKPMTTYQCSMESSFSTHWKRERPPLDIAHRGLGVSHQSKWLAAVRENTVASLEAAASHGADYVEFDVQLTKDHIPVVYHDFQVCLAIRKKSKEEHEFFEFPVKDLTLDRLQSMKLAHISMLTNSYIDLHSEDMEPGDVQPFPTLQRVFEALDDHTGFNIEVKYAMQDKTGKYEQDHYFERNKYIDTILQVIMEHAGTRRIILSCFDPDCCILLRLKQNKYPVLFLTQADTHKYIPYMDKRTLSVPDAVYLALAHQLLGVNVESDVLLDDPHLIDMVLDKGLVLFSWGDANNDPEVINKLKKAGVDGMIYDRIDIFKSKKENVFKMEHEAKLDLWKDLGMMREESNDDEKSDDTASSSCAHCSPITTATM